ncbi:hypothetical protein [Rhodopirellula sp. SWK7]|uniref:hypothetical protein n=1 Tax=Rhodopirellula sp. SWK7 TaxID=595460 RepID=UPI0011819579|nr:hypothetical protein [Rhodopirellula sp. SWK7]
MTPNSGEGHGGTPCVLLRYTFALSTGVGLRFQLSDRVIARFDYGFGVEDIDASGNRIFS